MMRSLLIIIAFLAVLAPPTGAAPPAEGVPTLETRVTAGCRFAGLVIVAQVVNLRTQPQVGGEIQTGDIKLVELIKGTTSQVPATIRNFKGIPRSTDSFKEDLEDQMTYLMFLNAPAAPGWEGRIPGLSYDWQQNKLTDKEFRAAVLVARSACRQ